MVFHWYLNKAFIHFYRKFDWHISHWVNRLKKYVKLFKKKLYHFIFNKDTNMRMSKNRLFYRWNFDFYMAQCGVYTNTLIYGIFNVLENLKNLKKLFEWSLNYWILQWYRTYPFFTSQIFLKAIVFWTKTNKKEGFT